MSQTEAKTHKARIRHRCLWCWQFIEVGETYMRYRWFGDDEPCTVKAHPELAQAGSAATYGMLSHIPLRGMVKNRLLDMFAGMYRAGGAEVDLHAAGAGGSAGGHAGPLDAVVERLAALYVSWKQRRPHP